VTQQATAESLSATPITSGPKSPNIKPTLLKAPAGTDLAVASALVLLLAATEVRNKLGGVVSCNWLEPWYSIPPDRPATDTSYCKKQACVRDKAGRD